ncbi:MAG: cell division protein FtsZ [Bifidobacteriaceae bacterium]|jgi:cell division protein FtsZ|nr:cell division protein FtsZ [Bifidobacteriaceae bacterium]
MDETIAKIKVIGVGGAGVNAVNHMIDQSLENVNFIAMNTDAQHLARSNAETKIDLGIELTKGLGAGSNPEIGKNAAEESILEIEEALDNTEMVIITAGEGGGTGTGASPIIAHAAKAKGILTIAIVTRPFDYEGKLKALRAEMGIENLRKEVDALIVVPNERLLTHLPPDISMLDAFKEADSALLNGVLGITDIIASPDDVSTDFADVRTVLKDAGTALMGIGVARGDNRATRATELATSSALLESTISGARGVLLRIQGARDLGIKELTEAGDFIRNVAHPDVNIITGIGWDDSFGDEIKVTIIAAGFAEDNDATPPPTSLIGSDDEKPEKPKDEKADEDSPVDDKSEESETDGEAAKSPSNTSFWGENTDDAAIDESKVELGDDTVLLPDFLL